ncbi:MAG: hypothetical protein FJX77_02000 [Armatimonadetes bacterium]|nr:hypothetical protein [Armatimonadota bacterium]
MTPAEAGADAVEYELEFTGTAWGPWRRTFSVADWFTGHDDIWALVRAFTQAPSLVGLRVPLAMFESGRGFAASVCKHAGWIHADLSGHRVYPWISISIFVQEADDPDVYRRFFLRADAEQVARFGRELEREIVRACPNWASQYQLIILECGELPE